MFNATNVTQGEGVLFLSLVKTLNDETISDIILCSDDK